MSNKIKIHLLIFFFGTLSIFAQKEFNMEKIKSLKVAFVTEKLNLTSSEAEVFWPIYNRYEKKLDAYRLTKHKDIFSKMKSLNTLSDKEASALLDKFLYIEEKENFLNKELLQEISKKVSPKKAFVLIRTEEMFKRMLIKQFRHKGKKE